MEDFSETPDARKLIQELVTTLAGELSLNENTVVSIMNVGMRCTDSVVTLMRGVFQHCQAPLKYSSSWKDCQR